MATNPERARFNMIEQQIRTWEVLDSRVLEVLREVPREEFAPTRYRKLAFSDLRIPLGHGQVMMKPIEEGRLLQSLVLTGSERVLEIGTGSGFLAACLGRLAAEVVSLEIIEDIARQASETLSALKIDSVEVRHADAFEVELPRGQFDAVVVTGSVPEVPALFAEWVADRGRLFVVRGRSPAMEAVSLTHIGGGRWHEDSLFETDLPRLIGAEDAPQFEF